jgi:ribosomal protein S18 acetylase RimI-like enzyme
MVKKVNTIKYIPIEKRHLTEVVRLCKVENWSSYIKDPEFTWRVLTAPGVTTMVAVDSDKFVGFVQIQSDGLIQAHLSLILVDKDYRRQGIGTRLIKEAFTRSGGKRIDLITDGMPDFYRSFNHKEWFGFRIHPQS